MDRKLGDSYKKSVRIEGIKEKELGNNKLKEIR